jgi:uncharacterized protein DUF397
MTVPVWRRSSRCAAANGCVQVGYRDGGEEVLVRDSTDPHGPVYALTREAFGALLERIKGDR